MKKNRIYTLALTIVLLCASMISSAQTPHKVCVYIDETCQSQCEDQITICFTIIIDDGQEEDCVIESECFDFVTKTTYCFFLDDCNASLPAPIWIYIWTKDSQGHKCCEGILDSNLYDWSGNPPFYIELENCE